MPEYDLHIEEPLKRQDIIDAARECLGVPFRHQGRIPSTGLDCVGLVRWPLVKLAGVTDDFRAYNMRPAQQDAFKIFGRWFDQQFRLPYPGDILFFAFDGNAQHYGILTYERTIIHAANSGPTKVIEHGYRPPWPGRCVAVFEYPGVEQWQP